MTRPNIPAALSFDSRGINNASAEYCPRLFTIAPGHKNDPQAQALGHAFAAVPALLEALEHALPGLESDVLYCERHPHLNGLDQEACLAHKRARIAKARDALIAAGYQF